MNSEKILIRRLAATDLFKSYEKAFSGATGMPVALGSLETYDLPFHGKKNENSFCALMASKSSACASCLTTQDMLRRKAGTKIVTTTCAQGLFEAAVPVHLGAQVLGYLLTGQILTKKPSPAQVDCAVTRAVKAGLDHPPEILRKAYLTTPVISREKFDSMLHLLESFGDLLSAKSNELALSQKFSEHPTITAARRLIERRYAEKLQLAQIAGELKVGPFHLCKLFRKYIGITFTEYVSRTRTEKAKVLLLNPHLRVSEIVFRVGFQSLTHFNRIFKKLVGKSPSQYRHSLAATLSNNTSISHDSKSPR